jgi:hypothetical protein
MQRIVRSLLDQNLIVVHQFTATDRDQKNWYSVEYEELGKLSDRMVLDHAKLSSSRTPKWRHGTRQVGAMDRAKLSSSDHAKMAASFTETNQETTTETSSENKAHLVFEKWKVVMNHPSARLSKERLSKIEARLVDGFSVDDLTLAVAGCRASPYHQGQNDSGAVYDDIELICRDVKHVEQFIARAQNGNGHPEHPESKSERNLRESFEVIAELRGEGGGNNHEVTPSWDATVSH